MPHPPGGYVHAMPTHAADTRSRTLAAALVLLAWAVILGGVLAIGWLLTNPLESTVDPWDDDAARWIADQRTPGLTSVADVGTLLGETKVGASVAGVAGLLLSLWRRSFVPAIFFLLLEAGIGGYYWVATHLITRDRPPVKILDPGLVPDHSYPSGHVATAVAAYAGIALLLAVLAPATRRWVWVLLLLPLLDVLARLYEGAHHVSDVAASVLYASAWMAVLAKALLAGGDPVAEEREPVSSAR